MMSEPLEMTLQERMLVLSFTSKSVEMLEDSARLRNSVDMQQWQALAVEVKPILARLDKDWPTMLPLPHDGLSWSERK